MFHLLQICASTSYLLSHFTLPTHLQKSILTKLAEISPDRT
jgi:hypothetical protein